MKNGTDTVDVYLCPKSFLDDMGIGFSKGNELAFIGSKVKQDGADLILAREVVKGNDSSYSETKRVGPFGIGIIEVGSGRRTILGLHLVSILVSILETLRFSRLPHFENR